ncbi:MAG: serine hydrolase [Dehalococcoidales bacterium]|nr:serine hydrolase [Dehalococcoidales bacterium]
MKKLLSLLLIMVTIVVAVGGGCTTDKTTTANTTGKTTAKTTGPDYWPTTEWKTSTPEAQKMDANTLNDLGAGIDATGFAIDSVVVTRNGYIVYENYRNARYKQETVHPMYSVTKSVLGALVGIAIGDGTIPSLDTKVMEYYKDRTIQNMDARKESITVRNLLEMAGGLKWSEWSLPYTNPQNIWIQALNSGDTIQFVLDQPMATDPGTTWNYCGGYSYMLADILEKATGKDILTYATEKLFTPMGITNVRWNKDKAGKYESAGGLNLSSRDQAKFGQMVLYKGVWAGKQLVPADYLAAATTSHHATNAITGYGYESWWVATKEGYVYCNGIYGQRVYVIPDKNIVVVFSCNIPDPDRETQLRALVTKYVVASTNPVTASTSGATTKTSTTTTSKTTVNWQTTPTDLSTVTWKPVSYINKKWGFKLSYPSTWKIMQEGVRDTVPLEIQFNDPTPVPGSWVSILTDSDQANYTSLSVEDLMPFWFPDADVITTGTTVLADNTTPAIYSEFYATVDTYPMHLYTVGYTSGTSRIMFVVWTIEDTVPWDGVLLRQIAHTMNKATAAELAAATDTTIERTTAATTAATTTATTTRAPVATETTYTDSTYKFSLSYNALWTAWEADTSENPHRIFGAASADWVCPGVRIDRLPASTAPDLFKLIPFVLGTQAEAEKSSDENLTNPNGITATAHVIKYTSPTDGYRLDAKIFGFIKDGYWWTMIVYQSDGLGTLAGQNPDKIFNSWKFN